MDPMPLPAMQSGARFASTAVYAAVFAFLAYTSVYAFRKPFTVAGFSHVDAGAVTYQTQLIIAQVIGYMLSKFSGIRVISRLKRSGRWRMAFLFTGVAWGALLFFTMLPPWAGLLCFLVNGYALGFMWGVVFSYVEGRRFTDFSGTMMAVSFIFAGGFTRSVARWLQIHFQVTDHWLPFVTASVFAMPFVFFIAMLERLPPPDAGDESARSPRVVMGRSERAAVIRKMGGGMVFVTIAYVLLTILRDIRDNYMANIWRELGYGSQASIFARTETLVSLSVIGVMVLFVMVRTNMRAFRWAHAVIFLGFLLAGGSSFFFRSGMLDGQVWMQLTGLGLYMAYVPFNCIFFERMIGSFRLMANAGFLMYITDSFGYLGSVLVMLWKEFSTKDIRWSFFFADWSQYVAVIGLISTAFSMFWFHRMYNKESKRI